MKLKCVLLSAIVAIGIVASAFADDEVKNQILTIDDFKGLNTKQTDISLPKEYSSLLENARFESESGSLVKRDPVKVDADCGGTEAILGLHRLYLNDGTKITICNHADEIKKKDSGDSSYSNILNLTTSDKRWQWITWHNIAIGSDGYNPPVKYDGASASATYIGSLLATDAGSGAGPDGVYLYKVECYTSSFDFTFNQPSNSITVADNDIALTMIPICPSSYGGETMTGRKIYRTTAGGSTYKLLSNGTIADNSTLTLTDSDADGALGATISEADIEKPPLGKFPIVHKNRLWFGNDPGNFPSRLFYGNDGLHDVFISDEYLNIRPNDGDDITGLFNVLGKLTVFKNNSIQKVYTDEPPNVSDPDQYWEIGDPLTTLGNQAPYSAASTPKGVMYLGKDGLYNFNGQASFLESDAVKPTIRDIVPSNYATVWSTYYNNAYYMAYTSTASGSSVNDRILNYDFVTGKFSIDTFSVNVLDTFDSGTDVQALYSGSSTDGNVYAHTDTSNEIIHKVHADFTGNWDDMRYIPTGVAGGDSDSPILEIAWRETIDAVSTTIDNTSGIIDRPDVDGTYTSQFLQVNASSFDKLYWNETIPISGGDVEFYIRTGATTPATVSDAWNGPYTNSAGTDISGVTASSFLQYRIDLTTDTITTTPTLLKLSNYVVRIEFATSTTQAETVVDFKADTGWLDFGSPDRIKELKTLIILYDWPADTDGTLEITFENFRGDEDVFEINLNDYPKWYKEQFTGGTFTGEFFKIKIRESSLNKIKIDKIIVGYDVSPFDFLPIEI